MNGLDACGGQWVDISDCCNGNWSTANTSIATVDTYGTHTGQGVGSTTTSTFGPIEGWRPGAIICPNGAATPSGGANVTPKILLGGAGGTDITNTTQSVVVGQQITLYAQYQSGLTVNTQSWSITGEVAVSYAATSGQGSLNPNVVVNQQSTTFYWALAPSSSTTVTFTLNYGSNQTATAQATFNISAPNPFTPTVTLPTSGILFVDTFTGCSDAPTGQFLVFGNISGPVPPCPGQYMGQPGINFSPPTTTTPAGTFFFVQLVTYDQVLYPNLTCNGIGGLDGSYPYQSKMGQPVNDAPFAPLPYTSITRTFHATMYLMWQSTASGSFAVPTGYTAWGFSSSTSLTNGVWSTPSGSGTAGTFVTASTTSDYPTWTGLALQANNNCH